MADVALAVQEAPDDYDDDIRNAISELKSAGTINDKPEAQIVIDQPKEDRARDEAGKFVSKPQEAEEKPKRETLTLPAKAGEAAETEVPAAPAPPAIVAKAPDAWAAPMKEVFPTLPPNVQAYINQREADAHKALTAQDEERKFGKQIKEMAQPFMATILAEGGTVPAAFQQFLTTAQILRGNNPQLKQQALRSIAQQFSVDLGNPLQPAPQIAQPVFRPEMVSEIVQAELTKQRQNQEQVQLQSEVQAFASDPANEFYEQLKPLMGKLLMSEVASDLKDAYSKAIELTPDIRSILDSRKPADTEKKRLTEQTKTDAAKRAAGSVVGGPGGAKTPANTGSVGDVEDDVRAAVRAMSGRV